MFATTHPDQPPFAPRPAAASLLPVIVQPDAGTELRAFGQRLTVLLSSADTGGALALFAATTPAGGGPPLHVHHREAEINLVLEGDMEFLVGDPDEARWTRVAPGGAAFLPPGVPHTFRNVGAGPARTLTVALPGGFEAFFGACAAAFAAADAGAPPDAAAIGRAAHAQGIEFFPTRVLPQSAARPAPGDAA